MRRLRIWLNIAILLIPLAFLAVGGVRLVRGVFSFLNSNRRLAGTISAEATRALGRTVRVGDVKITGNLWSLDSPNRIDLYDVYVANGTRPDSGALGRARIVSVWYNLRQLIAGEQRLTPLVDEIRVVAPEILLQRSSTGRWNYQDLLRPQGPTARPFADKISFTNGTLLYSDRAFPHPAGVPSRPLDTRLHGLHGMVLIRPDKSIAFDVSGAAEPRYLQDFHISGTVVPSPLRLQARAVASQVALPAVGERFVAPGRLRISEGHANLEAGVLYAPPVGTPPRRLDTKALIAHGTAQLFGASMDGSMVYAPAQNLNGVLTFTSDSVAGTVSGLYAGMPVQLNGSVLGLVLPPLFPHERAAPPPAPPSLSVRGKIDRADWRRIARLSFVPQILARVPQRARADLRDAAATGDLNFEIAGPATRPEAAISGRLDRVEYAGYRGENLDVRALVSDHTVRASVTGRYAGGEAVVRGSGSLDGTGTFQAQAQGRNLDLSRLGPSVPVKLTGRGRIDFAIRGARDRTPNITAQAEAEDISINGQALRHAFARVDTAGPTLVVRTLTADDPKGFIAASGTVGLKSKQLNLVVDGDELNFASIAQAATRPPSGTTTGAAPNPTVNRAVGALADLKGFGYARTHVTGSLDDPMIQGQVYAFGVELGAAAFDRVTLSDFSVSKEEIRLNGVASRYPGDVRIVGGILRPFSPAPELRLDPRVEGLDLRTLMQLAGIDRKDLVVTGTLTTDTIPIRGTLDAPQTPDFFNANLQNASVNGVPILNAAATLRYQVEGVLVKNASATIAEGLVVGSGWIPFDGPLNVSIHGGGLALQPIEEAAYASASPDQNPVIVRGDLNFDATVGGTLKQPVVTAQSISTGVLDYNGYKLGSIRGRAFYADGLVRVEQMTLHGPTGAGTNATDFDPKEGVVAIDGLTYQTETKEIHTDAGKPIRVESFPLERIRDIAAAFVDVNNDNALQILDNLHSVTGPISATAALGGTVENPQADLTWTASGIKARGYDITSVTGSAFVDKDKLVYPSPTNPTMRFTVRSPSVDVFSPADPRTSSIVIGFDKDGKRGQITTRLRPDVASKESVPADVSVSNINLQFLQSVLGNSITSRIEGAGNVDVTAVGRTTSPELEFTANLSKVAVYSAIDPKARPITLDRVELVEGSAREGSIKVGSLRAIKNDPVTHMPYETSLTATLIGFTFEPPFLPPEAELSVHGSLPVGFIAVAVPGVLRDTSRGAITVDANVRRLRDNPLASGEITLNVPRLEVASAATGIQDLVGTLKLNNDRLSITDLSAHTYIYGRTPEKAPDTGGALAADVTPIPQPKVKPATTVAAENDPKRRGSEIRVTGSLPLGFGDERTVGPEDGLTVRIFDPSVTGTATPNAGSGPQSSKPSVKQAALTFNEDPFPGNRTGLFKGSLRTDPNRPLQIRGSVTEPVLTGRAILYNAVITPPAEQKPGSFVLPILPNFDLALQLGSNVRIRTGQLDARLSTDRDIVARGRLLESRTDLNVEGTIAISDGKLKLPTASFTILPGATLRVSYPTTEAGEAVMGMNIDLRARGNVVATSQAGVRKRYEVTVTARGPLTGESVDPLTGTERSGLALSFETNPNDLASSQSVLAERLAGAIIGVDSFDQAGRNPGQAFTSVLSSVFTGSVLPGIFDRTAANLGFEELAIGYDPIDRLTLNVSRHLFGPLYVSYYRTLTANYERYDLKFSYRFKSRYQLSFDIDEQHTQKLLLEGVWRF